MTPVTILLCCTRSHAAHAAVAIRSILDVRSPARPTRFVVLSTDMDEATGARLSGMVDGVDGVSLDILIGEAPPLPASPFYPPVVALRFAAAEALPDVDRVLYLDADTVVLRDPAALHDIDLGDAILAAADDPGMREWRTDRRHVPTADIARRFGIRQWRDYPARHLRLSGAEAKRYFNSGVLVIDLARWRAEGITARIVEAARDYPAGLAFPDQDLLNRVLGARRVDLDPRWNAVSIRDFQGTFLEIEDPWIVHYAGAAPWTIAGIPRGAFYWSMLARTPFADTGIPALASLVDGLARQVERQRADMRTYVALHPIDAFRRWWEERTVSGRRGARRSAPSDRPRD